MFWYKILKLLCSHLLPFLLVFDIIVVFHYLFAWFPILLHYCRHEFTLSLQFNLLFSLHSFFRCLLLMYMFLANSDHLLSIICSLLWFPYKIFRHPYHLTKKEIPMRFPWGHLSTSCNRGMLPIRFRLINEQRFLWSLLSTSCLINNDLIALCIFLPRLILFKQTGMHIKIYLYALPHTNLIPELLYTI